MTWTFEGAIAHTQELLSQPRPDGEFAAAVSALLTDTNGARGFWVAFLTGEGAIADQEHPTLRQVLAHAPLPALELLVKNLAMSTAMALTHRRQGNEAQAQSSERVARRSRFWLQPLHPRTHALTHALVYSARTGTGDYAEFLTKWGYDQEQRQAIAECFDDNGTVI
ncbi:MAG: hypothetical protein HC919_02380 [Oscillatoriales cyanobacterium SM2_2_1]|nr:hypothetical protein [Oscillatoriales cyanobacterium SM2_2_1]